MVMVIKSVLRLIESFKAFEQHESEFQKKIKINILVTSVHVALILLYTLLGFLVNNAFVKHEYLNAMINPAWVCLSGLLDLLLSYMMFFIFDEQSEMKSELIQDKLNRFTYTVYDVINVNQSSRNGRFSVDSSSSSEQHFSSIISATSPHRLMSFPSIHDLSLSVFLEVEENTDVKTTQHFDE